MILAAAEPGILSLADALERITARAGVLDRSPRFPEQNFRDLQAAGVLCLERYGVSAPLGEQLAVVRAVACADGSTARILDGHLNGVERILALGSEQLGDDELADVAAGALWVGVWGADPVLGEGDPAWLAHERQRHARPARDEGVLLGRRRGAPVRWSWHGIRTASGGAGGIRRRHGRRCRSIARGIGRRGFVRPRAHRVLFTDTPVLALLGGADELLRQPYFARDAVPKRRRLGGSERRSREHRARGSGGLRGGYARIRTRTRRLAGCTLTRRRSISGWRTRRVASMTATR